MNSNVAAVRQNLALIVDRGRPVPRLTGNVSGAWGSAKNQFQYTWRSGLGIDSSGNLVYVAGDKLTLTGLAQAMAEARVQRGMELDIHPAMVTFNLFHPSAGAPYGVAAAKLPRDMTRPADRHLAPDQRHRAQMAEPANPSAVDSIEGDPTADAQHSLTLRAEFCVMSDEQPAPDIAATATAAGLQTPMDPAFSVPDVSVETTRDVGSPVRPGQDTCLAYPAFQFGDFRRAARGQDRVARLVDLQCQIIDVDSANAASGGQPRAGDSIEQRERRHQWRRARARFR